MCELLSMITIDLNDDAAAKYSLFASSKIKRNLYFYDLFVRRLRCRDLFSHHRRWPPIFVAFSLSVMLANVRSPADASIRESFSPFH